MGYFERNPLVLAKGFFLKVQYNFYLYEKFISMKKYIIIPLLLFVFCLKAQTVQSPSKQLSLEFKLAENGKPTYSVTYKNKPVVLQSNLGIKLKEGGDLVSDFSIDSIAHKSVNDTWQPVLGEQTNIKNNIFDLSSLKN